MTNMDKKGCLLLYAFFISGYVFCSGASDDWMSEFEVFDDDFEKDFANNHKKVPDSGFKKDIDSGSNEKFESWFGVDDLETDSESGFRKDTDNDKKDSYSGFEKDIDNQKGNSGSSFRKSTDNNKKDFDNGFGKDIHNPKRDSDSNFGNDIGNHKKDYDNDFVKDINSHKKNSDSSFGKDIDDKEKDSDDGFGIDTDNHKKDSSSRFGKDINNHKINSDSSFGKDIDNSKKDFDSGFGKDNFDFSLEQDLDTGFEENNIKDPKKDCDDGFGNVFGNDFGNIDNNVENCIDEWFTDSSMTNTEEPKRKKKTCNLELIGEIKKMLTNRLKDIRQSEPLDFDSELRVALFMKIHDGKMTGLSTLTNVTEIKSLCMDNNTKIILNTTLRMTEPKIVYNWTRTGPLGFTQKGIFWIKAEVIYFYIEIVLHTAEERKVTYNVTPTLMAKAEDFTMKFEGLWVFDYVVNFWIQTIFKLFKLKIKTVIEGLVKYVVEQKVDIIVRLHNNPIF